MESAGIRQRKIGIIRGDVGLKKYWNALLYGNAKTKRILWSSIGLFFLMVIGGVIGISGGEAVWLLIAVFALIMNVVLLQSVRFGDVTQRAIPSKHGAEGKKDVLKKSFESLSDYTEEDIRQLLVAYRVKKEHVPVMIDSYVAEKVRHCPAFLWKDRGYLNLLVLEEKPRNIAVPLNKVTQIGYERDVEVNPAKEYEQMRRPSVVNIAYQGLMPSYRERQRADGRRYYTKNLYIVEPGIKFTNTSMQNVLKVLHIPISFDGVSDDRYSDYYKEVYRKKLLLMDQIISADEYRDQVSEVLKQMADSGLLYQEFCDDLERMVNMRLVTREVAGYFMDYRQKLAKKKK